MKKISLGLLLVGLLTITGCAAVAETFDEKAFHTQDFLENYYRTTPDKYKSTGVYAETIYDLSDHLLFSTPYANAHNMAIIDDLTSGFISLEKAIELYGDEEVKSLKKENFPSEADYVVAVNESLARPGNMSASWEQYARYNSLSSPSIGANVAETFKHGVFSKLTDSLVVCHGGGSLNRVQIDEDGFGQTFRHELIDYKNLIVAARGGTNVDYRSIGVPAVRRAKVKINISFFIEKSTTSAALKHTISYVVPEMHVDDNSITTIMKINLSSALPQETLKRASGLTVTVELMEHDYLMPGGVKDTTKTEEFALMLYEIMLPHSTWR